MYMSVITTSNAPEIVAERLERLADVRVTREAEAQPLDDAPHEEDEGFLVFHMEDVLAVAPWRVFIVRWACSSSLPAPVRTRLCPNLSAGHRRG